MKEDLSYVFRLSVSDGVALYEAAEGLGGTVEQYVRLVVRESLSLPPWEFKERMEKFVAIEKRKRGAAC